MPLRKQNRAGKRNKTGDFTELGDLPPVRDKKLRIIIEVRPQFAGQLLIDLTDKGFAPRVEVIEDLPLGRRKANVTTEEIILGEFGKNKIQTITDLAEKIAVFGKARTSCYGTLTSLKKKGRVKNIGTGQWEFLR